MKKIVSYTIFSLLIFTTIHTQECPPVAPAQRDLLILPDTASEETLELMGHAAVNKLQITSLERMLKSMAAPVLVELSIWKRFAQEFTKKPIPWFHEEDYDFYKVGSYLLCIPTAWKKQMSPIGLHLKNLKKVGHPLSVIPGIKDLLKPFAKSMLLLVHVYSSLVKTLRTILVPSDYAWNIVLEGHGGPLLGSYQSRIAGIPFREFKKLLQFLKTEIKTNMFLYTTCYAGSKWLLKVYTTHGKPDTYPFPIILTGITEAPTYGFTSRRGGTILGSEIYKDFFQKIKTVPLCKKNTEQLGLIAGILLQAVRFNSQQKRYVLTTPNNILQIRWQYATQFQPIPLDKVIQLTQQHPGGKLEISADALLLENPVTKKAIYVTKPSQAIVSIIPQKRHFISSVTIMHNQAPEQSVKQLLDALSSVRSLESSKIFLIDELRNNKEIPIAHNILVLVSTMKPSSLYTKRKIELFYTVKTDGYLLKKGESKPVHLSKKQTKRYQNLYQKEKRGLLTQNSR